MLRDIPGSTAPDFFVYTLKLSAYEQAVSRVGDDEIREDGMGMAAGTDEAQDAEAVAGRCAANEVHQGAAIIGMDCTRPLGPAAGTGLQLGTESGHEGIEQDL